MKVSQLRPNMGKIDVKVKVVSVEDEREVVSKKDGKTHKLVEALVGDETGSIVLSLWNENTEYAKEGNVLQITNGYTTVVRGSLRLSVGKYGGVEVVEEKIDEVNTDNNLSERSYPQPRRYDMPRARF